MHHPCNENTRTMQKQCFGNEIVNLTGIDEDGFAVELQFKVVTWVSEFQGCLTWVSDLASFLLQTHSLVFSHTFITVESCPQVMANHMLEGFGQCWYFSIWQTKKQDSPKIISYQGKLRSLRKFVIQESVFSKSNHLVDFF